MFQACWVLNMNGHGYSFLSEIGKGSFGTVYKARRKNCDTDHAIKKVRCDAPENVELALQEFWTLSCLGEHANIIKFEECFLQCGANIKPLKHGDNSSSAYLHLVEMAIKGKRRMDKMQYHLWFVMEYCDCGDMNEFILGQDPMAYMNTIFMLQLADGIAFLHKSNVVHRDLKPENILVKGGRDPILKIADFGLSKVCSIPIKELDSPQNDCDVNVDTCWLSSACGSDFFMAPEVFEGHYTAKADVFALGIIFWAVMDRITFIDAGTKKVLLGTYVRRDKEVLPVGEALLDDPNLDVVQLLADSGQGTSSGQRCKRSQSRTCVLANKKNLRDLVAQMVHPNPEFRPSSQELLGKLRLIVQACVRTKYNGCKKFQQTRSLRSNFCRKDKDLATSSEPITMPERGDVVTAVSLEDSSDVSLLSYQRDADVEATQNTHSKKGLACRRSLRVRNKVKSVPKGESSDDENDLCTEDETTPVMTRSSKVGSRETEEDSEGAKVEQRKSKRRMSTKSSKATSSSSKVTAKTTHPSNHSVESGFVEQNEGAIDQEIPDISGDGAESEHGVTVGEARSKTENDSESKRAVSRKSHRVSKTKLKLLKYAYTCENENSVANTPAVFSSENCANMFRTRSSKHSNIRSSGSSTTERGSPLHQGKGSALDSNANVLQSSRIGSKDGLESVNTTAPPKAVDQTIDYRVSVICRRRIGLKEQICQNKSRSDVDECRADERRRTVELETAPFRIEEQQPVDATTCNANSSAIAVKQRLEVPRTPCIVKQNKGIFRQNPFQCAVKKRWRYVVLDDPSLAACSSAQSNNEKGNETSLISNKTTVPDCERWNKITTNGASQKGINALGVVKEQGISVTADRADKPRSVFRRHAEKMTAKLYSSSRGNHIEGPIPGLNRYIGRKDGRIHDSIMNNADVELQTPRTLHELHHVEEPKLSPHSVVKASQASSGATHADNSMVRRPGTNHGVQTEKAWGDLKSGIASYQNPGLDSAVQHLSSFWLPGRQTSSALLASQASEQGNSSGLNNVTTTLEERFPHLNHTAEPFDLSSNSRGVSGGISRRMHKTPASAIPTVDLTENDPLENTRNYARRKRKSPASDRLTDSRAKMRKHTCRGEIGQGGDGAMAELRVHGTGHPCPFNTPPRSQNTTLAEAFFPSSMQSNLSRHFSPDDDNRMNAILEGVQHHRQLTTHRRKGQGSRHADVRNAPLVNRCSEHAHDFRLGLPPGYPNMSPVSHFSISPLRSTSDSYTMSSSTKQPCRPTSSSSSLQAVPENFKRNHYNLSGMPMFSQRDDHIKRYTRSIPSISTPDHTCKDSSCVHCQARRMQSVPHAYPSGNYFNEYLTALQRVPAALHQTIAFPVDLKQEHMLQNLSYRRQLHNHLAKYPFQGVGSVPVIHLP